MEPRPSLLCSTLSLSDNGTTWREVWADIPEADPQVLDLLAGSQVCVPSLFMPRAMRCEMYSAATVHSLKPEVPTAGLGHFFDPSSHVTWASTSPNAQNNPLLPSHGRRVPVMSKSQR